jgi:putative RNA 2'-phosphotransferase
MLSEIREKKISTLMCYILRHNPHEFNLNIDRFGACEIEDLLKILRGRSNIGIGHIYYIVDNCQKQRFEIIGSRIRARYGHSFARIEYEVGTPTETLYHGTNTSAVESILKEGLSAMDRAYVHMSEGTEFATLAGKRRGKLVLLTIDTKAAIESGIQFYSAGKDVWLADKIPASCITVNT